MYLLFALAILIVSTNIAIAQVSPLQQPQSLGNQNQPPVNIMNNLFNNPAASNYASSEANPYGNSPYSYMGGLPQFPSNFWGNLINRHIVEPGTVLTGTLQDDLSSKTSKTGDVFAIILTEGYRLNNELLIPANAKIVGTVVSAIPAAHTHNGVPGSLQISLQTLSLPDGRSVPINAIIQYNPNQSAKIDIKKGRGIPVGEYLQSAKYSIFNAGGSLTRQVGLPLPIKTQTAGGSDFVLTKGELLPVKLTQPLDVTAFASQPFNSSPQSGSTLSVPAPNPQPAWIAPAPSVQPERIMPTPGSLNNTLPGNNAPAGPEPF